MLLNNAGIQQRISISDNDFYKRAKEEIEVIEMIPPALNTDLGGKGLHSNAPPVSDFIEDVFIKLKQGKSELTSGFSESMAKAGPEDLQKAFDRMNNI